MTNNISTRDPDPEEDEPFDLVPFSYVYDTYPERHNDGLSGVPQSRLLPRKPLG